jgi:hypothetical protein
MATPISRLTTRVAYSASQLPRLAWYVGHNAIMRRLSKAARQSTGKGTRAPDAGGRLAGAGICVSLFPGDPRVGLGLRGRTEQAAHENSMAPFGSILQFFGAKKQHHASIVTPSLQPHCPYVQCGIRHLNCEGTAMVQDQKQCPRCMTMMLLERILAKFGPLPELHTYRCPECRCVVEEEIGPEGRTLSTRRVIDGLPDYVVSKGTGLINRSHRSS